MANANLSPGISAPTTGSTVSVNTILGDIGDTILNPLGTLAALTFQLADGQYGGQRQSLFTSAIITVLTLSGNFSATIGRAQPTTLTANQTVEWVWDDGTGAWVRRV